MLIKFNSHIFLTLILNLFLSIGFGMISDAEELEDMTTEIKIAPYASYIQYEEPDVMKETGFMGGLSGDFSVHWAEGLVLGADGSLAAGLVDYESNGTGSIDNISDFMFELRGSIGYDIWLSERSFRLTPFAGLGYRFLRDAAGGEVSTTGALGYDRHSNYAYIPVGIKVAANMNSDWKFGLNLEYDIFLKGLQQSELGDAISGLDTVEHDQDEGFGIRGSVSLTKKMKDFDLSFEPFVRYWDIEQSDTTPVTFGGTPIGVVSYEPKNTSTEIGLMVGVRY